MTFKHTNRPGFWLGFVDFFTAGLFFVVYMPLGLQQELESILGHKIRPYWQVYLLGIPDLFIYPLVWMARIAEELKAKAIELGIEGPHTSWKHMFWWNMLGCLCFGPMIATHRFFKTLNRIETELNRTNPGIDSPHTGRKITKDERQVLLEHPELVMFDVKWELDIIRVAIFFIPGIMSVLIPAAIAFSPFGKSHPGLVTVVSIALLVLFCAGFVWLYMYLAKRRYEKAQQNHNIKILKKTLPKELFCKVVTIQYVIEQQAEGAYIEDGEEKRFGYAGYNNYFPLVPGTDVVIVTDHTSFWAFVKRDDATESFYSLRTIDENTV